MGIKVRNIIFLFATLICFPRSEAHRYHVGGKGGWIINPHIRYNHWSDRTRFVVHDTLVFKYNKGEDSVLLVTKDDYYNCNTKSPVDRWDDGATEVALNMSGAFFFLSGEEEHCHKGQRMIVVVLPWSPQPPISLPPQPSVPEPPHASPAPGAVAPKSPPITITTPVMPPIQSPSATGPTSPSHPPIGPPSSPKHAPTPVSTPNSPPAPPNTPAPLPTFSVQTPSPTPTQTKAPAPAPGSTISSSPAPAPAGSSASAIAGHHALSVTVVIILLSAIFS